ncbi:hypothetical protein OIU77_002843 [Salix suchowensis]|uniref:Cysteine proteinase inhibitor n=1 Tax=Salix suchowensis TaxID=1278906 RepID=A0ABQ9AYW6_9ROSI|nr:hypothetical protein OIU77_002843 [Salix suchowensis]
MTPQSSQNSVEIDCLARFAVDEHNKKEVKAKNHDIKFVGFVFKNVILEFTRVVKAKEQVVAGQCIILRLKRLKRGRRSFMKPKFRVKPWLNFKELHDFKMPVMFPVF